MLLYSILHLAGVERLDKEGRKLDKPAISLDDIKSFRQLDSVCPGHPEYGHTTGVEITTGPLGQGCGDSVGMAMAERWLANRFNRPGYELFDYNIYALCSDGDLMEGVSNEAASLAGHLKLSNLCWIYDSNTISIEGHTEITFTEDVAARFRSYGWNTMEVPDANDCESMARALNVFQSTNDRPTLIVVKSVIGYGAPHKENTAAAHGEALGEDEVRLAKHAYGWAEDAHFLVPEGVRERFAETLGARGAQARAPLPRWQRRNHRGHLGSVVIGHREEQRLLVAEVVEDRAPREPDLGFESPHGRAGIARVAGAFRLSAPTLR